MRSNAKLIFVITVTVGCFISLIVADEINWSKAKFIQKFYDELGCREIIDSNSTRYDCPDFKSFDTNKCHLKGKSYNVSEMADEKDQPHCTVNCICLKHDDEPAMFHCANVECPEDFGERDWSCVRQYTKLDDCCSSGEICGQAKMAEMTKCYIEGKPYQIGEHIYPDSEPCYMCHCTESFTNSTEIAKNSNCKKIDCGSELRHLDDIKVGCIPIHLESSCCATGITWKCPSDDDVIIASPVSNSTIKSNSAQCKFGKNALSVGDRLKVDEKENIICECAVPPMISCVFKV